MVRVYQVPFSHPLLLCGPFQTHNAGLGQNWGVYVAIMVLAIVIKLGLYLYCRLFSNEIVQAYAQDHFFDVVTNVVGLGAAVLAGAFAWWIDPLGAILVCSLCLPRVALLFLR